MSSCRTWFRASGDGLRGFQRSSGSGNHHCKVAPCTPQAQGTSLTDLLAVILNVCLSCPIARAGIPNAAAVVMDSHFAAGLATRSVSAISRRHAIPEVMHNRNKPSCLITIVHSLCSVNMICYMHLSPVFPSAPHSSLPLLLPLLPSSCLWPM